MTRLVKKFWGAKQIRFKAEAGFTLVELLVALSIAAAILGVMTMTIITVMRTAPRNNAQAIVFTQVQDAGLWISRDAMMADNVTTRESDDFLSLGWTELSDNLTEVPHTINYVIDNTVLKRQTLPEGGEIRIAEYIDPPPATSANFTASDNTTKARLVFTIQSSFGDAQTQRTYTIVPRRM